MLGVNGFGSEERNGEDEGCSFTSHRSYIVYHELTVDEEYFPLQTITLLRTASILLNDLLVPSDVFRGTW
jgi:hypothetical protein